MDMELSILVAGADDFTVAPPLPARWRWLAPARAVAAVLVLLCVASDFSVAPVPILLAAL